MTRGGWVARAARAGTTLLVVPLVLTACSDDPADPAADPATPGPCRPGAAVEPAPPAITTDPQQVWQRRLVGRTDAAVPVGDGLVTVVRDTGGDPAREVDMLDVQAPGGTCVLVRPADGGATEVRDHAGVVGEIDASDAYAVAARNDAGDVLEIGGVVRDLALDTVATLPGAAGYQAVDRGFYGLGDRPLSGPGTLAVTYVPLDDGASGWQLTRPFRADASFFAVPGDRPRAVAIVDLTLTMYGEPR